MTLRPFEIVIAVDLAFGIGYRGQLPWAKTPLTRDLREFRELTTAVLDERTRNCVIMGRNTWLSLPDNSRPLPNRLNIVITGTELDANDPNVLRSRALDDALELAYQDKSVANVFVIGGAALYAEALAHPQCWYVRMTRIYAKYECDTHFPPLPARFRLDRRLGRRSHAEHGIRYELMTYSSIDSDHHDEYQYLNLAQRILDVGIWRADRTGVGTLSLFGAQHRWDLRHHFPLLTTKRVFWRGVAEELLWFVRGSTDAKLLQAKDVHIWDENSTRQFLDSRGLTDHAVGDLGPVYGFQWRHFGATYTSADADYTGQGVDQLAQLIETIKTNPTDRRLCMSAWNPAALAQMALPPCHMFAQFYVADGHVSCHMYQRSADLGLGVPFNIASYALLTYMVAHVCGLKPGELIHSMGDAHIYMNHIEPLREQLLREPTAFPTLRIKRAVTEIDQFEFDDFELLGYNPQARIKMDMAV